MGEPEKKTAANIAEALKKMPENRREYWLGYADRMADEKAAREAEQRRHAGR